MIPSAYVTRLKGLICLCASEPHKTQTGVSPEKGRAHFWEAPTPGVTGELPLKTGLPGGFRGTGFTGERSLTMVTQGVRVMVSVIVSADGSAPGSGVVGQCSWA